MRLFILALALLTLPAHSATLADYQVQLPNTNNITIYFDIGLNELNPSWDLPRPLWPILFKRLSTLTAPHPTDALYDNFASHVQNYRGLQLRFALVSNSPKQLPPLRIINKQVTAPAGMVAVDPGRLTEYWLFGTAPKPEIKTALVEALPVATFEQCQIMGNTIVNTTPRQCVLPDKSLVLETFDVPNEDSLTVIYFHDCLKYGRALINTFPRRCLLPGGRVIAEPPVPLDHYQQRLESE